MMLHICAMEVRRSRASASCCALLWSLKAEAARSMPSSCCCSRFAAWAWNNCPSGVPRCTVGGDLAKTVGQCRAMPSSNCAREENDSSRPTGVNNRVKGCWPGASARSISRALARKGSCCQSAEKLHASVLMEMPWLLERVSRSAGPAAPLDKDLSAGSAATSRSSALACSAALRSSPCRCRASHNQGVSPWLSASHQ
ncbi:hypothetical protein D3C79_742760 [compost metagenome]